MSRQNVQTGVTALRRVDPQANMARFYTLQLWPDLFGRVALVREWGRIGQPGHLRIETYADASAAAAARDRLVARKTRKGYEDTRSQGSAS
jgi:predicted DNA-binding WGR domain protein